MEKVRDEEYLGDGVWVSIPTDPLLEGRIVLDTHKERIFLQADLLGTLKAYAEKHGVRGKAL